MEMLEGGRNVEICWSGNMNWNNATIWSLSRHHNSQDPPNITWLRGLQIESLTMCQLFTSDSDIWLKIKLGSGAYKAGTEARKGAFKVSNL